MNDDYTCPRCYEAKYPYSTLCRGCQKDDLLNRAEALLIELNDEIYTCTCPDNVSGRCLACRIVRLIDDLERAPRPKWDEGKS